MLGGIAKMSAAQAAANEPWRPDANTLSGGMAKMLAAREPAVVAARGLFGSLARLTPTNTDAYSVASNLITSPYSPGNAIGHPTLTQNPTDWARIQLAAGDRENLDPEDIFDPLAPVRTELYNAARYDLRQLQPNNYALTVPSFRTLGGAPTIDEISELKYAYRVAQSTQPLAEQAARVAGLLDSRAQNHRVVAVLQTSEGTFIAGSGSEGLRRVQRDEVMAAKAIQVPAAGEGVHAEIAALKFAENRGKPQFIAASQPFCLNGCREAIRKAGGLITSPTTAVFPLNIPSVAFPLR
jgi:hypothetical protein